jgi:hypothetical protein
VSPHLVPPRYGLHGQSPEWGVTLERATPEEEAEMLSAFASIERIQDARIYDVLDAAARLIAVWRYDGRGDPLVALDELEAALRRLR